MITKAVPEADVTGCKGRSSSFEVTVNDNLIYSKLKLGGFPAYEDVVKEVERASRGQQPEAIQKAVNCICCIL